MDQDIPQKTIQEITPIPEPSRMAEPNQRVILRTARLLLRPAHKEDALSLHSAFADPEVMRFWDSDPHGSMADTQKWVDKMLTNPGNGTTDFIICRTSAQATTHSPSGDSSALVIGKIGVWNAERAEIGFLLKRDFWRQGLVSEAMEVLLPYLFGRRGLERITADIDPDNTASRNLLAKFGFRVVGHREKTFCIGGVWVDSLDLLLTKAEYLENKASGRSAASRR